MARRQGLEFSQRANDAAERIGVAVAKLVDPGDVSTTCNAQGWRVDLGIETAEVIAQLLEDHLATRKQPVS